MKDIVEEALENAEGAGSSGQLEDEPDSERFGEPELTLLGYGRVGGKLLEREWVRDYPDVETRYVQRGEELRSSAVDADYAILVGDSDDDLAAAIGERLPEGTTSVAVPISAPASPVGSVESANVTIPCPPIRVDELVSDLLTVLRGRTRVWPSVQFYDQLRTVGRVHGFRGERDRADAPPDQFASELVTDALGNPFDAEGGDASEPFFSFLRADDAVTLETFDALRNEITDRFGGDTASGSFAVDTTGDSGADYRLTLLRR